MVIETNGPEERRSRRREIDRRWHIEMLRTWLAWRSRKISSSDEIRCPETIFESISHPYLFSNTYVNSWIWKMWMENRRYGKKTMWSLPCPPISCSSPSAWSASVWRVCRHQIRARDRSVNPPKIVKWWRQAEEGEATRKKMMMMIVIKSVYCWWPIQRRYCMSHALIIRVITESHR